MTSLGISPLTSAFDRVAPAQAVTNRDSSAAFLYYAPEIRLIDGKLKAGNHCAIQLSNCSEIVTNLTRATKLERTNTLDFEKQNHEIKIKYVRAQVRNVLKGVGVAAAFAAGILIGREIGR